MTRRRSAWVIILCLLVIGSFTAMAVAQSAQTAPSEASKKLVLLHYFETGTDLSPDDLVFSPANGGRLINVGVAPSMLSEWTIDGELVGQYQGLGGNSIARSTRGPNMGHLFQAGGEPLGIFEYAEDFAFIRHCLVPVEPPSALSHPGDALAFNHHRSTFLVSDLSANLIHEVDCRADGTFVRSFAPSGFSAPAGMTFDVSSGTYFGVLHMENALVQFDDTGTLIRWFDLAQYGVQKPVGVTVGQGKLFIADELSDDRHDITGFIYVFLKPRPVD